MATATQEAPVRLQKWEYKEAKFFAPLSEGVIWLRGKAGGGKTATMVDIAYKLRKYFGKMPILDFHPKPKFGPYEYMGPREFVTILEKMGDLVESGKMDGLDEDALAKLFKEELGIDLMNATIGLDEAYRYLRNRHPTKRLVLAYGDFIATWRHYHLTIIMCSPFKQLDKLATGQVTLDMVCSYDPRTRKVMAKGRDTNTLEGVKLITPMDWCGELYDSWNPLAILRRRKIEVQGL